MSMSAQEPVPAGARKIFATRTHGGLVRRRYVGHTVPGSDVIQLHSHQDRGYIQCEVRAVIGEEAFGDVEMVRDFAARAGWPEEDARKYLRNFLASAAAVEEAIANKSGRMGPDQEELPPDGSGPESGA